MMDFDKNLNESIIGRSKQVSQENLVDNADEEIKKHSELIFKDPEVSRIFYEDIVDKEDYEDNRFTLQDAEEESAQDLKSNYGSNSNFFQEWTESNWCESNIEYFDEFKYFTGLKKVPNYCFMNCKYLKEITFPPYVEEIEDGAFVNNRSLSICRLPKSGSLKYIGECAFANTGFTEIIIPEGVEIIDDYAFSDCQNLVSVTFPSTLKKIGYCAFSDCRKLANVNGIENVKEIKEDAFYDCFLLPKELNSRLEERQKECILYDGTWLDDSDKVEKYFLETYLYNNYNEAETEDQLNDEEKEEWQNDELNPKSENFDKEKYNQTCWEWVEDDALRDFNDCKEYSIKNSRISTFYWINLEDDYPESKDLCQLIDECIPENYYSTDLNFKIVQRAGGLEVAGTMLYPTSFRSMYDDELSQFPDDLIDWNSRRYSDRWYKDIFSGNLELNESIIGKSKKVSDKDLEKKSDRIFLYQRIKDELKKYIKEDGNYNEETKEYSEDLPGFFSIEEDGVEYFASKLIMETYNLDFDDWNLYFEMSDGEMSDGIYKSWDEVSMNQRNTVLYYFSFPKELMYPVKMDESIIGRSVKMTDKDIIAMSKPLPEDYIEIALISIMLKHNQNDIYKFKRGLVIEEDVLDGVRIEKEGREYGYDRDEYIETDWVNRTDEEMFGYNPFCRVFKDLTKDEQLQVYNSCLFTLNVKYIDPIEAYFEFWSDLNESIIGQSKKVSQDEMIDRTTKEILDLEPELLKILSKHSIGNSFQNHFVKIKHPTFEAENDIPTVKLKVRKNKRKDGVIFAEGELKSISWSDDERYKSLGVRIGWSFKEPYETYNYSSGSIGVAYFKSLSKELQMEIFKYVEDADKNNLIESLY